MRGGRAVIVIAALVAAVLSLPVPSPAAPEGSYLPDEIRRLGERMYRDGLLPSGEPMKALVRGDVEVPGTAFTCVSCHLRAGLGSYEGGVFTPPTNGAKLFAPLEMRYKGMEPSPKAQKLPPRRPAYTDETLAEALAGGIDPTGRVFPPQMPRYLLGKEDMSILISYLKTLSVEYSPGVTDTELKIATVVSADLDPAVREAMLVPLRNFIAVKNNQATGEGRQAEKSRRMLETMLGSRELATRRLALSVWELKGAPGTWRAQLEEYNRKEPVFSLLAGMTGGEWEPVHRFCEEHEIPALMPLTDFPVVSDKDWYTLYFSKGYYQEGEGVARYLNRLGDDGRERPVLQIVRDSPRGRQLAAGFEKVWSELGHRPPMTVVLKEGVPVSKETLLNPTAAGNGALVIWDGSDALAALSEAAVAQNFPAKVFLSGSYLGEKLYSLDEKLRDRTFIAYPFRLPEDEARYSGYIRRVLSGLDLSGDKVRIASRTQAATDLFSLALMDMRGNYYRDNFLDVVGMMKDQDSPLYPRLSFGPGQRYASKGCYIVQLTKGAKPHLVAVSDWVIH